MYNRYIRTESGSYTRIPQEEPSAKQQGESTGKNQASAPYTYSNMQQ